jgi:hypothetical protein
VYPHRDFFHADFGPVRHWVGRPPGRSHAWSASGFIVSHQGHVVTNAQLYLYEPPGVLRDPALRSLLCLP